MFMVHESGTLVKRHFAKVPFFLFKKVLGQKDFLSLVLNNRLACF